MEKKSIFDKKKANIIDTVEYNGKYTNVTVLRTKALVTGAILLTAVVFIAAQFFFI
ncbi:hypothetical protein [Butyrivibrio sp. AC2005]|uniref:hypothetical protein n=1 Tax=Butyrivibrio sp. AC2005 TaxID=1280672 RepID=UPI000413775F|nr:hypothetical protein [Butyrivibrio sp. AC2005]